jgi:hypothetical protein
MEFGWETSLNYENWFFYYCGMARLLKQLLDDLRETRRSRKLTEEALDGTR